VEGVEGVEIMVLLGDPVIGREFGTHYYLISCMGVGIWSATDMAWRRVSCTGFYGRIFWSNPLQIWR
jgi:hypothetical protein